MWLQLIMTQATTIGKHGVTKKYKENALKLVLYCGMYTEVYESILRNGEENLIMQYTMTHEIIL